MAQPSQRGAALFLAGGRIDAGIVPSLYDGVHELQPGHTLLVADDGSWRCHKSWEPERDGEFAAQPLEVVSQRLQRHLDGLADRILAHHDRVACLFSGGLDSSLVAATLLRREPDRVVLFNVGSALGTAAESALRTRFLREYDTVSHSVDLPVQARLISSLRATNAAASLPTGSPFSHVFEEIIGAAQAQGCSAIVTGDGGDEIFAEREEILVDLLARRARGLFGAAAFFALRNGEPGFRTLRRAKDRLRSLHGLPPGAPVLAGQALWNDELTGLAARAGGELAGRTGELWNTGWTLSGIEAYRRAAAVPEWEPVSSGVDAFPVISPLADAAVLKDALALRREAVMPTAYWGQRKWLLRHAALHWLSKDVAMHPKIGSADGQILERVRTHEHPELLELLSSDTARRIGVQIPPAAESTGWQPWHDDGWIRTAAVVAWLARPLGSAPTTQRPPIRDVAIIAPAAPPEQSSAALPVVGETGPAWGPPSEAAPTWRVAVLTVLALIARLTPRRAARPVAAASPAPAAAPGAELPGVLIDMARRACSMPWVNGSARVMSTALVWYLRLCGKRARLVEGTAEGRPGRCHWVEVDGLVVEVSGIETPLMAAADRSATGERTAQSEPESAALTAAGSGRSMERRT